LPYWGDLPLNYSRLKDNKAQIADLRFKILKDDTFDRLGLALRSSDGNRNEGWVA